MNAAPTSRVLITGAGGFVGRALLEEPAPFRIRAAFRSGVEPGGGDQRVAVGDIDGRTDWSQALRGVDGVVHLAAHVHVMRPSARDLAEFERTNVLGSERLAREAASAGVRRFVYLSSIKVNGESTREAPFRADDVPQPRDEYARSKLEAEQRLAAVQSSSGMAVAIVRPPLIYGPGVRANFLRLLSMVSRGVPIPLAAVDNRRSLLSVWNLCDLIRTLLLREQAASGVVLVADAETISTAALIRRLAQLMRRPVRLFPVPVGALRAVAALCGRRRDLDRLCGSLVVDIAETCSRLRWSPPLSLESGLERTVQWYLRELADAARA